MLFFLLKPFIKASSVVGRLLIYIRHQLTAQPTCHLTKPMTALRNSVVTSHLTVAIREESRKGSRGSTGREETFTAVRACLKSRAKFLAYGGFLCPTASPEETRWIQHSFANSPIAKLPQVTHSDRGLELLRHCFSSAYVHEHAKASS